MRYPIAALLTMILTAAVVGCGRSDGFPRVAVAGEVRVDGQPMRAGLVRFVPAAGVAGPTALAVVEDGVFILDRRSGPVAGEHRVEIEATGHLPFQLDDEQAFALHMQQNGRIPENPIPPQFNRQSQLRVTIPEGGQDDLHFQVMSQQSMSPSVASRR